MHQLPKLLRDLFLHVLAIGLWTMLEHFVRQLFN